MSVDIFDTINEIYKLNNNNNKFIKNLKKKDFDDYLVLYIKNKLPNRYEKMKQYMSFGFDINDDVNDYKMPWLYIAVQYEDIPLIGLLIKNNANIHHKLKDNTNIIYSCIMFDNLLLLKFFLKKCVSPNYLNDSNNSPLIISCIKDDGIEFIKTLLEYEDIIIDLPDQNFSPLDIIIRKLESNKMEYIKIFNILINRKKKMEFNDMMLLRNYVLKNRLDIVKLYVDKFPNILNKSSDDHDNDTIVHMAIYKKHEEMIKYFFSFKNLDIYKKNNTDHTYLDYIIGFSMLEILEIYCKNYPKSLKVLNENKKNIIEELIINPLGDNLSDNLADIIKIVCKYGTNINNINNENQTPIFSAIQYSSFEITKLMLELGAKPNINIEEEIEIKYNDKIDILIFCIQKNKFEEFKLLIDKKAKLYQITIENIKIYSTILSSILYNRYEFINYLFNIKEIKLYLEQNDNINSFLFDYSIKNGCNNNDILNLLIPEYKINLDYLKSNSYFLSCLEKRISIYVPKFNKKKEIIIDGLIDIISILKNYINIDKKKLLKLGKHSRKLLLNMTLNNIKVKKSNNIFDYIETLIIILCDILDYHNNSLIKHCIFVAMKIELKMDINENDEDEEYIKPKLIIKKINELSSDFIQYENKLLEIYKLLKNNRVKLKNNENENNKITEINHVIKKLFKLYCPIKQPHYNYMYHNLVNNNDTLINNINDKNIAVINSNNIKSVIFYNDKYNKPSKWINTYAPNIGSFNKSDENHTFSFLLDTLLVNHPVIETNVIDPNHENGLNSLLYFYGILEYDGHIETGCFEYFINSKGTLFHRMFRPYNLLCDTIKNLINK